MSTPEPENPPAMPAIQEMREAFEAYISTSPRFKDNTPLGHLTVNGEFSRFMNPDTDTMWIGFALGYRSHAMKARAAK